jgi:hypothetical protein
LDGPKVDPFGIRRAPDAPERLIHSLIANQRAERAPGGELHRRQRRALKRCAGGVGRRGFTVVAIVTFGASRAAENDRDGTIRLHVVRLMRCA